MRVQILAPVDGKFSYIATSTLSSTVKEGDVLCELIPDSAPPSESPEIAKNPVTNPAPAPATAPAPTTKSPVAEPKPSSSLQSLSAFGPASELAKRLRESRQRLASIAPRIEASNAQLTAIQQKLLAVQGKGLVSQEEESQIESKKQATEEEIKTLKAEQKLVATELSEAEHEQATILKLLENQLSAAHRQLEFKQAAKERIEHNQKLGLTSLQELNEAEQAFAEAESEVQQLELLLQFYANIGKQAPKETSEE